MEKLHESILTYMKLYNTKHLLPINPLWKVELTLQVCLDEPL